jgi:prepilin-type processing-associated H-X9-DG protein
LPVLARAKAKALAIDCLGNMKQLQTGWHLYTVENNDFLPGNNYSEEGSLIGRGNRNWLSGSMDIFTPNTADNTNTSLFLDAKWSQLGPYIKSPEIYRCKTSKLVVKEGGALYPLARTVSMNGWMGYINVDRDGEGGYVNFRKSADITGMPTSDALVFMDERDDSVDDGYFAVDMARGWFVNTPSCFHNGAASVSFADGHTELHRWRTPNIQQPQQSGLAATSSKFITVPDSNEDLQWLRSHATCRR